MTGLPTPADERRAQQDAALAEAQRRRKQLRLLRQALANGELDPWATIRGDGDEKVQQLVGRMKVRQLLMACPRIGESRMVQLCVALGVSPARRVEALSQADRHQLADMAKGVVELSAR